MATTPNHIYSLLALPCSSSTDFIELADNCERFVEVLVETYEPADKLALCGKLSSCLNLLRTTLGVSLDIENYCTLRLFFNRLVQWERS